LCRYTNKIVFSDCWNLLYNKSASFRCDGRLVHSPGPAAANAVSQKVLYVRVTAHVRLAVERSWCSRASATRQQLSARTDEWEWQRWSRQHCVAVIWAAHTFCLPDLASSLHVTGFTQIVWIFLSVLDVYSVGLVIRPVKLSSPKW